MNKRRLAHLEQAMFEPSPHDEATRDEVLLKLTAIIRAKRSSDSDTLKAIALMTRLQGWDERQTTNTGNSDEWIRQLKEAREKYN